MDVYNASTSVKDAQVSQDMFLLEPTGTEVVVSERVVYTNTGKLTYQDPEGSIRVFVPSGVTGPVQVRIQAPQGMPIVRPAEKGKTPNLYVVKYPIKPGETNVDVSYSIPMSANQATFEGKIIHSGGPIRFVAPSGVKLEGPFVETGPDSGHDGDRLHTSGSRVFNQDLRNRVAPRIGAETPEKAPRTPALVSMLAKPSDLRPHLSGSCAHVRDARRGIRNVTPAHRSGPVRRQALTWRRP